MPRNKIDDLRNHLFETIEMLKDKEIDVNTAKAISEICFRRNFGPGEGLGWVFHLQT